MKINNLFLFPWNYWLEPYQCSTSQSVNIARKHNIECDSEFILWLSLNATHILRFKCWINGKFNTYFGLLLTNFSATAVMNETSQWIWSLLIVCLFAWQMVRVNGAIVPPPWSDPNKNPCASMPGGWQLLYWAPLKQCFKIFTVRATSLSGMSISWPLIHQFIVRRLDIRVQTQWNWRHPEAVQNQMAWQPCAVARRTQHY